MFGNNNMGGYANYLSRTNNNNDNVEFDDSRRLLEDPPFSGKSILLPSLVSGLQLSAPSLNSPIVQLDGSSSDIRKYVWEIQPVGDGGFRIFHAFTGGAMQPQGMSSDSGTPIVPATLANSNYQIWDFISYNPSGDLATATYMIRNRASGLYLDITGDKSTPGTRLIQFASNALSLFNQVFLVQILSN